MGLLCHGCRLICLRHRLDGLWSQSKGGLEKLVELMGQEPIWRLEVRNRRNVQVPFENDIFDELRILASVNSGRGCDR